MYKYVLNSVVKIQWCFPSILNTTPLYLGAGRFFSWTRCSKSTIVISLYLNAAFDTVDHDILLSCLSTSFRISDLTFSWPQFYTTNRTFLLHIGCHCCCRMYHWHSTGFHPGATSLHGLYISPIAGVSYLYRINLWWYADDTQLFISLSPSEDSLTSVTSQVALTTWMSCST